MIEHAVGGRKFRTAPAMEKGKPPTAAVHNPRTCPTCIHFAQAVERGDASCTHAPGTRECDVCGVGIAGKLRRYGNQD